jgi:hypothetical protein
MLISCQHLLIAALRRDTTAVQETIQQGLRQVPVLDG